MTTLLRCYCPHCDHGTRPDGRMCGECLGQGHADYDPAQVARDGLRLWVDRVLPELPDHITRCC